MTPDELRATKLKLLNLVSASLIKEPRFNAGDSVTVQIKRLVKLVAFYDPEFVLKLALYTRDDLNIRSASNFVVALASDIKQCQPFIKKYLKNIIRLPSDWLDVASTYQMIPGTCFIHVVVVTALLLALSHFFLAHVIDQLLLQTDT
jgi:telomerase protein component 1